ncbi:MULTISPECIES: hypothetical protein [Brevibacterium]|uniref:Uncharacterized protein n=3 Tax=Brevibacterium TaxID=1696 RepID=A0A2H1JS97_9MICO|nr:MULTISPECIES: hypothetical protein [Brevibacterium]SMX90395.1 hypothetical protein BANT918_01848 [Brevibacterium antiquum CNRZ 918]SMY00043.1 hypothetical protein BANT10_03149 [Brevibacterium antiquum]HCG56641.1 hypothetical protein [Brevibacterium sp.]
MNNVTADLETEVRRLRIRIIGLNPRQLAETGPNSPDSTAGILSRRGTITEALAQFSSIGSEGRAVPELGDQSLADQVVVLIDDGIESAANLPETQRLERLELMLDAAVRLRRGLA